MFLNSGNLKKINCSSSFFKTVCVVCHYSAIKAGIVINILWEFGTLDFYFSFTPSLSVGFSAAPFNSL